MTDLRAVKASEAESNYLQYRILHTWQSTRGLGKPSQTTENDLEIYVFSRFFDNEPTGVVVWANSIEEERGVIRGSQLIRAVQYKYFCWVFIGSFNQAGPKKG